MLSVTSQRRDTPIAATPVRDRALRCGYLRAALPGIPRLLGAIDRNPYRKTYGCLDRQFWHYRTAAFPSEMYQEGAWPLAIAYLRPLPGNRWHGQPRVRELAVAALRFAARSCHRDGSCDDYYPYERALGAAVFSLLAAVDTYRLLELQDDELLAWLRRRADWVAEHDESGRLANHHALAALGLLGVGEITGEEQYRDAAQRRVGQVLAWQSDEGWFEEYGGADPGYQTVTIDALAKYRLRAGALGIDVQLDEPLRRAVRFARWFLHPDGSYGGEYGSRGTCHFYPHGMELLAGEHPEAAELAEGFLRSLAAGKQAYFDDDRMFAHRLGNLLQAYEDYTSYDTPYDGLPSPSKEPLTRSHATDLEVHRTDAAGDAMTRFFPAAGILVRRDTAARTVVSAARGGVFKHFPPDAPPVTDAGLIVELHDGRVAVSQQHDLAREFEHRDGVLSVAGPLHVARFETATPWKQAALHLGMCTVGRWCRTLVRKLLQRRLITGHRSAPLRLTRRFEFTGTSGRLLRVTDTIELTNGRARVRRMSFGSDHQSAYVAATGVYQEAVLHPWTDLNHYLDALNRDRRVTIIREFPA